jgi:hypothetical protein
MKNDIVEKINHTQFLGTEFLTWLWYQEEKNQGKFQLEDGTEIELWFEDKLSLASVAADSQEDIFKGGRPTSSVEARAALKLGKTVKNAKISVIEGDVTWVFQVKAEPLMMTGIKLPATSSSELEIAFFERMESLERLSQMYEQLLSRFLKLRLTDAWQDEILAIQEWVKSGIQVPQV